MDSAAPIIMAARMRGKRTWKMTVSTVSLHLCSRGNTRVAKTSNSCPGGTEYRPRTKERIKISMSTIKRTPILQVLPFLLSIAAIFSLIAACTTVFLS